MKKKLSEWASIAEIIAATGVVFSLLFVGMQINEGNQETRAATIQATADAESFMLATMVNHSVTWHKVIAGIPLESGAESHEGVLLYNMLMVETENRYHQFHSGFLDALSWESRLSGLQPTVKLPIFTMWRESLGARAHSPEFLKLIDSLAD